MTGVEVPERAEYLRVIFSELQRIASHAMANGTLISDAGAWQTPLLYMFREREKILDLFEMTCGARLTTNYMRSEEHTSELQSLMRTSYAVFCLKKKKKYASNT